MSPEQKSEALGRTTDADKKIDFSWTYAVRFKRLGELVEFMRTRQRATGQKCSRLAIMAHGRPGLVDIESVHPGSFPADEGTTEKDLDEGALLSKNIPKFDLAALRAEMEDNGTLYFMSCNMGGKTAGAQLLIDISLKMKDIDIVGFTRVGTTYQVQSVERCDYPGMKVGDYIVQSGDPTEQYNRRQALLTVPFASEKSQFAKVARNGKITKDPEPEQAPGVTLATNTFYNQLIGRWTFEIGSDFQGNLVFEGPLSAGKGKVSWAWKAGVPGKDWRVKHFGTWKSAGGTAITFTFDDDQKGWERLFSVNVAASSNTGNVTIKGVPHGFFKMVNDRAPSEEKN